VEEAGDVRRGDGIEVESVDADPEFHAQVLQQHPPGIAVGADRVARQVPLAVGEGGEVGLQAGRQRVHEGSPGPVPALSSRRPAARAMSSPVALRYQYVWA